MKSGIFLSVREKATRFPGKVLKPLGEKSVTAFLIERLRTSKMADMVVMTTSTDPRDEVLCAIAESCGIETFCGSPEDKLLRYRDAARAHHLDFVVIVDGDDPFVSIEHIDRIISYNADHSADYTICDDLPLGATGFGLRVQALEKICVDRPEQDTEVWGQLFLDDPRFNCAVLPEPEPRYRRPDIRMTLDYPADYEFFTTVVNAVTEQGRGTDFNSIMDFLSDHPEAVEINQHAQGQYEENLQKTIVIQEQG